MTSGSKHTLWLVGLAILLVVIAPVAIFFVARNNDTATNTNAPAVTNISVVTSNSNTAAQTAVDEGQAFYIAQKTDATTTVYSQDANTGERTEVFHYDEGSVYATGSENTYQALKPSIAYNSVTHTFAFAAADGLYTYNVQTGTQTPLVTKTGSSGRSIDGVEMPIWSNNEVTGVFFLFYPQYSADGTYISFSGAPYEGVYTYILNTETNEITTLKSASGEYISGQNVSWSPTGHKLVVARPIGYGATGLYIVTHENFDSAVEILHASDNDIEPYSAVFTADGHVAYSYTIRTATNGIPETSAYHLAIINSDSDGSGQADIVDDSTNNIVLTADENIVVYVKQNPTNSSENGFWTYNIDDGANTQLAVQAKDHLLIVQSFYDGLLTYIDYNNAAATALIYFVNPKTLDTAFASTGYDENSVLSYIGR